MLINAYVHNDIKLKMLRIKKRPECGWPHEAIE
jgi:hypothetical protein